MKKTFFLVLLITSLVSCQNSNKEVKKTISNNEKTTTKWYSGGNLHKATGTEWKKATASNKLATCADFAFTYAQNKGATPIVESSDFKIGSFHLKKGGMTNGNKFCEQSVSSPHGNSKSHDFIVC